jgi:hypothetical protein
MCYAMTITALRKLLDHAGRMRHAVAVGTLFYGRVFIGMTRGTGKVMVFRCICLKQGHCLFVTSTAIMRRDIRWIRNHERHMDRMAGFARLKVHIVCVFFVTLHTNGDQAVLRMTLVAGEVRVRTGMLVYLFSLLCMT